MQNNPLDQIIEFLRQVNEVDTAKNLLDTFKKYSNSIEQYDLLGRLYHDIKDYNSAIECANNTLVMGNNPYQMYAARSNLAKMYNHINQPEKSLQYINANLSINENDYEAKMEKVFSLYLSGKYTESYTLIKELLEDDNTPENVRNRCLFNSGSYQLDEGNFKEGIRNFIDVGHKIGIWKNNPLPNPWNGEVIENATLAIIAEGGIGDEVINVRFMKDIEELGMKPVWVTNHKELIDVFNRNGFKTVDNISSFNEDTYFCYSFYLPILLDLDKDKLDHGIYLQADPSYIEKWRKILPEGNKVALRWSGNQQYEQDLHRSLSLSNYMNTFGNKTVKFISIQRDTNMDELKLFPDVFDASKYLETIDDLLACISLCDSVVSSCTSVAHIAAASGCNLNVLPPIACYYTWLGSGNDWYGDHVKVIRQKKHKDFSHLKNVSLNIIGD